MSSTRSARLDRAAVKAVAIGNRMLLLLVFATVFLVPLSPASSHWLLYNVLYTVIYLLAALSIERHRRALLLLALSVMAIEWASELLDLPLLTGLAGTVNIVFFILIVTLLIAQIARSPQVTGRVIVEAINGYLLIGLIFALLVILLGTHQPGAYSFVGDGASPAPEEIRSSDCFYYAFVTLTTVGYGDLLPLTPQSKALASMMGAAGQLYLAVIIAMLIGKYSSSSRPDVSALE